MSSPLRRAVTWRALAVFALLALLPLAPWMSPYYLLLAFDALLFGAVAMSLDLLMGYTGLVSFGHAAFFGLGAYATAVLLERGVRSLWLCLAFAVVVVGLYALVVAYFATARRGIYFALLTLVFAEVVYTFFRYTQTFGGSDGIQGLPSPELAPGVVLDTPLRHYYVILAYLGLAWVALRVLVQSHFGRVLVAIRENEDRARFLGYNVQRYKLAACVISAPSSIACRSSSITPTINTASWKTAPRRRSSRTDRSSPESSSTNASSAGSPAVSASGSSTDDMKPAAKKCWPRPSPNGPSRSSPSNSWTCDASSSSSADDWNITATIPSGCRADPSPASPARPVCGFLYGKAGRSSSTIRIRSERPRSKSCITEGRILETSPSKSGIRRSDASAAMVWTSPYVTGAIAGALKRMRTTTVSPISSSRLRPERFAMVFAKSSSDKQTADSSGRSWGSISPSIGRCGSTSAWTR